MIDNDIVLLKKINKQSSVSGIPVKYLRPENMVHHKFCLIDSDKSKKKLQVQTPEGARKIPQNGVVMSGSLNWTFQVCFVTTFPTDYTTTVF